MYGYFNNKAFNEINANDITDLLESKERESQFLDYKQNIDQLDDVISDVCSFANAQGGYIIVGISEKGSDSVPEGYPEEIIGVEDPNRLEERIREKIKDLINPQVLGFNTRQIKCNEKFLILIFIPNSIQKPYFVRNNKGGPFPIRVGRTKSYWQMGDIRNVVLAQHYSNKDVDLYIEDIKKKNDNETLPKPFASIIGLPTFIVRDHLNFSDNRLIDLLKNNPLGLRSTHPRGFEFTYQGIQISNQRQGLLDFIRIHRTGVVELSVSNIFNEFDDLSINPKKFEVYLERFVKFYSDFLLITNHYDPIICCVYFKNIVGKKLEYMVNEALGQWRPSQIRWYESYLTIKVTFDSGFDEFIKSTIMERLYNSFNWSYLNDDN